MEKEFLKSCLKQGMSLDEIGTLVDRHPSTVAYHLKRYGLSATHREKFAARGGIAEEVLEIFVGEGASLREMAEELDRSISTVRYWLKVYRLEANGGGRRRKQAAEAVAAGVTELNRFCEHHGYTRFVLEGRGYYRCAACRSEAVARRRRNGKAELVEEAGGACLICGYDRYQGALQFHHLDPAAKRFAVSRNGVTRALGELRAEAEKCVLLCANCHAEVEAGITMLPVDTPAGTVGDLGRG